MIQTSYFKDLELEDHIHESLQAINEIVTVEVNDIYQDEDSDKINIVGEVTVNDNVTKSDLQDYINLELPGSLNLMFLSQGEPVVGEDNFRLRKILSFL